jgi:hypothetical protein
MKKGLVIHKTGSVGISEGMRTLYDLTTHELRYEKVLVMNRAEADFLDRRFAGGRDAAARAAGYDRAVVAECL